MKYLKINILYIELTHTCNQHCKHCYLDGGIDKKIEEMTTNQVKGIISDFKEQNGKYIILTGGEPLIRKDIFEILDYIEELKIPFSFASNSLAMTEKRLEKLASYESLDMYFTSLLGVDKEKHMYITEKDSFENVFRALSFFEKRKISTYVQVTLADSFDVDMKKIMEALIGYSNCTIKFTPIGTLGIKSEEEWEKNNCILFPKSKVESFNEKVRRLQKIYPDRIEDANILDYSQILNIISDYKEEELYYLSYGFVAVRPNGDISFSCNMNNPFTFGKAYESLLIPIDKRIQDYISLLRRAEMATLEEARETPVEFDVTVDKYIRVFSSK